MKKQPESRPYNKANIQKIKYQYYKTSKAFGNAPKTMLQVSLETGILRANICRYVATMRKEGHISLIYKGLCPISNCRAGFYLSTYKREGFNNE